MKVGPVPCIPSEPSLAEGIWKEALQQTVADLKI